MKYLEEVVSSGVTVLEIKLCEHNWSKIWQNLLGTWY